MTRTQGNSSVLVISVVIVFVGIVWVAYDRHLQFSEEGLVYVAIFQPNPSKIQFNNVVALSRPSICKSSHGNYKSLPSDVVLDFEKANRRGVAPIRLSVLEGKVPIVRWDDTKRLHEKGITDFFRPESQRLLYLSRVGFNQEKTEAIACIEISEGSFGEGILIFLKKRGEDWSTIETRNIWIS